MPRFPLAIASCWRGGVAVAALVLLPLAGCMYPWDDLRSEDSDEAICTYLCATYEKCISAEPGCEGVCESDIRECPSVQKDALRDCVDELDSDCGELVASALYDVCVSQVACYQ